MSEPQQIINVGQVANDGTGEYDEDVWGFGNSDIPITDSSSFNVSTKGIMSASSSLLETPPAGGDSDLEPLTKLIR